MKTTSRSLISKLSTLLCTVGICAFTSTILAEEVIIPTVPTLPITEGGVASTALTTSNMFSSGGIIQAIENLNTDLSTKIDGVGIKLDSLFKDPDGNSSSLFLKSKEANISLSGKDTQGSAVSYTSNFATDKTDGAKGGSNLSAPTIEGLAETYSKDNTTAKIDVSLEGADKTISYEALAKSGAEEGFKISDGLANVNTQLLLTPLSYSSEEEFGKVDKSLALFSNYLSPLGSLDLELIGKKVKPSDPRLKRYRLKLYSMAAIRALVLDNLYQSVAARTPVNGLGKKAGMEKDNASPEEVSHYIATRRVNDPTWYDTVNQASPIAVQRETLYTLAEIQESLYRLHSDNERILQTLSAMTVLSLQAVSSLPNKDEIQLQMQGDGSMDAVNSAKDKANNPGKEELSAQDKADLAKPPVADTTSGFGQ